MNLFKKLFGSKPDLTPSVSKIDVPPQWQPDISHQSERALPISSYHSRYKSGQPVGSAAIMISSPKRRIVQLSEDEFDSLILPAVTSLKTHRGLSAIRSSTTVTFNAASKVVDHNPRGCTRDFESAHLEQSLESISLH